MIVVSGEYGGWIETLVRDIAAGAGVPDFVFKPIEVDKGGARREVGDALLWIGHQIVVVSIKSRDPGVGTDTPERRDSWLNKNIAKAIAQINGTIRTLRTKPDLILVSERGVSIPWDVNLVDEVIGVVVVDHPDLGPFTPDSSAAVVPTQVISAEDWHILHTRLWSTASVVGYLHWRTQSGLPPLPFVAEKDVIASSHIAEADLPRGTPFEVKPGAWEWAWAERPEIFFGTDPDHRYARIVDAMIAGAAEQDPLYTNVTIPSEYLRIIEFLDRIPPFVRVEVGKGMMRKCKAVGQHGGYDAMLAVVEPGLLVMLADDSDREQRSRLIQGLTLARHTQVVEATGRQELVTLGIATEPSPSPGRSQDFVYMQGISPLTTDERRRREVAFGPLPDGMVQQATEMFARFTA